MNLHNVVGESSCKRQENGDVLNAQDRPLKKARFAWQVKGNQQGKSIAIDQNNREKLLPDRVCVENRVGNETACNNVIGNTEQNLEILGDYLLKQDFNTLDSVITDSSSTVLPASSSMASGSSQDEQHTNDDDYLSRSDSQSRTYAALTDVIPLNEDQCIARWQARQMAKGFVDNTINRVVESWMAEHYPVNPSPGRYEALYMADLVNNLAEDNTIENEGILMAISAHGLRNALGDLNTHNNDLDDDSNSDSSDLESNDDYAKSNEQTRKIADLYVSNNENSSINDESMGQCDEVNNDFSLDNINSDYSHFNFMDAAVSFAIENKGLASFSTDYG